MTPGAQDRTYRFAPLDRMGWILGLQGAQCLALALGTFLAGALLNAHAPAPAVMLPVIAALVFAFVRVGGRSAHEWTPVLVRFGWLRFRKRTTWFADLPLLRGDSEADGSGPPLPPFLEGLSFGDAGAPAWVPRSTGGGVGVVRDSSDGTLTATIRVHAREFSLCERPEQERLVASWGDALAAFCVERGAVDRLRWTEWAAPAGLEAHRKFVDEHAATSPGSAPVSSYIELLENAGPLSTCHEVLVAVTVDPRRVRHSDRRDREAAALDVLFEEVRLLTTRLEAGGLMVDPPLSPAEMARTLRLRCDPAAAASLSTRARSHSLAELAGRVSPYNAGPLSSVIEWSHLKLDGAYHRTYWCAEWPRLEVGPNWMEQLILHAGTVRTVSMIYEPVRPSRSQRQIDRDSTRLTSDEEQRSRSGFRIGAGHRRAQAAVAEREAELVAGYAELEYAGFVTVTAPDVDELRRAAAEYEQVAAQAGMELRSLEGRHDLGFLTSLPVGRGLASRRFA